MINRFDQGQMYEATLHACVVAVQEGFPHLAIREILDPPHHWFDAALARQIVMHLMVRQHDWPKRRVVETEDRSREAINRALRTIDERLITPRFETHYRSMAERSHALLALRLTESEAA
ncbi:hypothetical protein SAMN05880590_102779 [Rhizobium sp. RU35A]|uniref:hypothetical protein n=1 Tax=Rhizobium sp. RU35A TaxID=1907414 RepID=UPI0009549ECC|nr:hypothetical protein [Rhizobium sp. RU35A]SIQ24698.1 hypothetical protein SAMN05880590_102779 [Rhizobium sp. RU35A]